MAGESPDRSKQGEQASEPALTATSRPSTATAATTAAAEGITSRNAGSVPPAASGRPEGARDPREWRDRLDQQGQQGQQDPRVAVALALGGGGSEGAEDPAGPEGSEEPEGPERPEGLERPEDSAASGGPEDLAGLETAEELAGSEGSDGPEGSDDPVDPAAGDREDAETSGEEPGGDSGDSDADSTRDSERGSEGKSDEDSDEDSDEGFARKGAAGEKGAAGDARLRSAVAAWVANANDADADDAAAENGTGDKKPADSDSGSDEPDAEEPETEKPEARASEAEAEAGTSESEDTEERVTEEEASSPAEKADPRVERSAEQESAAEEEPAAPESSVRDEDDEEEEDEDGPEAAKPEPAAEPESSKPQPEPKSEPSKHEPPAAKPTVDQPTTAIRVVRPPNVDQPTTMLKLGGALPKDTPAPGKKDAHPVPRTGGPKGTPRPGAAKPGAPKPGVPTAPKPGAPKPGAPTDAERTSQFIALRPLPEDARRPLPNEERPKPSADATTALPRVGPNPTMQQPLPPKPPIDLLAELTNTPPPPATWWRVSLRRVKIYTPLAILLVIIFAVVQQMRTLPQPTLTLTATDSHTFAGKQAQLPWPEKGQGWMDADGIGTIDHFGEQKPVPIGSVAKTMTAYIVLKDHPLKPGQEGPKIPVDALAEKEAGYDKDDESTLNNVKEGEELTEKQALSAIMIPSANNIARLLARWDAGSEAAFVKKMNETAKQLGMENTTYTDPSGLTATTVSTAEDQVKLGNAVVDIPALVDITRQGSWTDPKGEVRYNYNHLIPANNSIGIKTGTTTAAGGCLLFAATKDVDGETAIVVGALLGQFGSPSNLDVVNNNSRTAMIAAQKALISETILKKGDVVGYVDDQLGGHTPVVVSKNVKAIGWSGNTVELSFKADEIPHTAKAGTQVGTLTVGDGTKGAVEVPVQLQGDLVEPGFGAKLTRIG